LKVEGNVLIVGCGNILLGDDGFGPAAANRCRRFNLGRRISADDVGTQLTPLVMDLLYGDETPVGLVILDAADGGRPPGAVFEVPLDDLRGRNLDTFGLHDFPSPAALGELMESKGVKIRIIACQPTFGPDMVRIGLSKAVRKALTPASRMAVEFARGMLTPG
jgi:coenzyme F420 hydrogenase subunit delta